MYAWLTTDKMRPCIVGLDWLKGSRSVPFADPVFRCDPSDVYLEIHCERDGKYSASFTAHPAACVSIAERSDGTTFRERTSPTLVILAGPIKVDSTDILMSSWASTEISHLAHVWAFALHAWIMTTSANFVWSDFFHYIHGSGVPSADDEKALRKIIERAIDLSTRKSEVEAPTALPRRLAGTNAFTVLRAPDRKAVLKGRRPLAPK